MRISEFLRSESIKMPVKATKKHKIIEELIDFLVEKGDILDREAALATVLEREALMTTGIGDEIAIPHAKATGVTTLVGVLGKPAKPVDWKSVDKKPVRLVFLMLSPLDRTGPHIRALSRIARLFSQKEFRARLIEAPDAQTTWDVLVEEDSRHR
jgi:PTS system nitrogen regulatory IIA component